MLQNICNFVALKQMYYLLQQNYLRICKKARTFAAKFVRNRFRSLFFLHKLTNIMKRKKLFLTFLMTMCCAAMIHAQTTATGVVVDAATGEPIIGASVLEEGTTNGTITDFDGNFTITVGKDAMVVISYVGYKSQQLFPSAITRLSARRI